MRWTPRGVSRNVEDRRGMGAGGKLGIGGVLIALLITFLMGGDLSQVLEVFSGAVPVEETASVDPAQAANDPQVQFVSFVLDDAQEVWRKLLSGYQDTRLVLFRGAVDSACGFAQAATGPFYCPLDQKVYIDLSFYEELSRRFGAPGEFAQAYVLAHEIGHHVQTLLGTERQVRQAQRGNPDAANALSVRMELQADCYAGIWGNTTAERDILEKGDLEDALNAAAAIGDDRLQQAGQGRVVPESFTHGSSAQRVEWFRRGFTTGSVEACDTFEDR